MRGCVIIRLIDADKLKELWEPIAKMDCLTGSVVQSCINELDKQPTVKAVPTKSEFKRIAIQRGYVPVVRCKDCKRWLKDVAGCTDFVGRCELAGWMIGANGYCLYGERARND